MAFDPFADGQATEEKTFDPFAAGQAVEDKPYDGPEFRAAEEPGMISRAATAVRESLSPLIGPTKNQRLQRDADQATLARDLPGVAAHLADQQPNLVETEGFVPAFFTNNAPWALPTNDGKVRWKSQSDMLETLATPNAQGDPMSLRIARAMYNPIAGTVNTLSSPGSLMTFGIGGELSAIVKNGGQASSIAKNLNRAVTGGFTAEMTANVIGQAPETYRKITSKDTDAAEKLQAGLELSIPAVLAGIAGRGMYKDIAVDGARKKAVLDAIRTTDEFKDFKGSDADLVDAVKAKLAAEDAIARNQAKGTERNVTQENADVMKGEAGKAFDPFGTGQAEEVPAEQLALPETRDQMPEVGGQAPDARGQSPEAGGLVPEVSGVDFARREGDIQADAPEAAQPDSFAGIRSDISGSRVSAAQALRIAERSRSLALGVSEPDAGGTGSVDQIGPAGVSRDRTGYLRSLASGAELKRAGGGAEADVYVDQPAGVVYKVFGKGNSGSIGQRFVFDGGLALRDTGGKQDVAEKVWVMNALGGTPTEYMGHTVEDEPLVKQPLGDIAKEWDAQSVNARSRLVEIPESVLPRPSGLGGLYLSRIDGQDVLVGDLHKGNYIGDTLGRGRIADLVTHRIAPNELEQQPKLKAWVDANRADATAPGAADFVRRSPEQAVQARENLAQRQARWVENARKIAPGVMAKYSLEFGDPRRLVDMGRAEKRDLTGYEEAAYLAKEKMLFLFDQALASRSELGTTINLLHEMGHAHWDTLPVERQAELLEQWRQEMGIRTGPLFTKSGALKRGVARGVDVSLKEWYAERIAWANHEWARGRIGSGTTSGGLIGRMAQQFRQLLAKLREYLQQLFGKKIETDFRTFADQGERFADMPAPKVAGMEEAPAFARRTPGEFLDDTKDSARNWLVRNFTSAGGLPKGVLELKLARSGRLSSIAKQSEFALRDLDRAMHAVYGGYRAMTAAQLAQINDVLGGKAALASIDLRLQGPLGAMRSHIDVLSRRLVREGVIDGDLAARVAGNTGFYLNRSYRKFDDPKWFRHVPEVVVNQAKSFIAAELQAKNPNKLVNPAEVQGYVEYLLGKDVNGVESFFKAPREGQKDLRTFIKRQEIPPEIRALLGEYHDPRINYLRSVAKTAQILESHQFLKDVLKVGVGRWLFDRPMADATNSYTVPIAPDSSEAMAPLSGLYTTPEIARAFQSTFGHTDDVWRWWMRVNGWAKTAKTVLSPMTQTRNFAGNFGFLVANGHWRADAGAAVWQALRAEFGWRDTPKTREYLARLSRLGITDESVNSGELKEAINDAGISMKGFEAWTDSRLMRVAKSPFAIAARIYRINDDLFKIYAFENERRAWAAAEPTLTPEQLDTIAAERVRNTFPTYSLIPKAARVVRRYALTGSFLSFPAEIVRTGYHTIGYAIKDSKSPNPRIKAMGVKRLLGLALVAALPAAVSMVTRWKAGLDQKDERDLRRFLPDWNANADLYFQTNDGKGRIQMMDASYLDPWSYMKKPVTAALRGEDWQDSLQGAAIEALAPFASEGVLTRVGLDLARNVDANGRQVWNPQAPFLDRSQQKLAYVWQAFEPGAVSQAQRIVKGATGVVSASGRAYNLEDEVMAVLTGARSQSIDVGQALAFRAKRFAGERNGAELIYRSVKDRKGTVTPEEVDQARATMETQRAALYDGMAKDVAAAQHLGLSQADAVLALKSANVGDTDLAMLLTGRYLHYIDNAPSRAKLYGEVLQRR